MQFDQCSICLDEPKLSIKLTCNHVFCFLCIKSVKLSHYDAKCPNCREPISDEILQKIYYDPEENRIEEDQLEYQWLYSTKKNGWWKFDPEHNVELEELYQEYLAKKEKETEKKEQEKKSDEPDEPDEFDSSDDFDNINIDKPILNIGYLKFKIDFETMQQINLQNGFPRLVKRVHKSDLQQEKNIVGIAGLTIEKKK